jgi:hypothetical protein
VTVWEQVKTEFEWDGSLRDLYILDAGIRDWQKLIDRLRSSKYRLRYEVDDEVCQLPRSVGDLFLIRAECCPLLSIEVDGIRFNCHFFAEEQIEFDLDPREIDGEAKLQTLFRFMQFLGDSTSKRVVMTPENGAGITIFELLPGADEIRYTPCGRLS